MSKIDKSITEAGETPRQQRDGSPGPAVLHNSGLVQPLSPRLGSGGLDNLLIQFQVLSLYQRTGILLEVHMRNGLREKAGWPLTTDWINLPGSTVVSLSFCSSGEH